jgi:hypothetical protein
VLLPDGAWHDVRPAPGHFVVPRRRDGPLTNDRWKSTVIASSSAAREPGRQPPQTVGFFLPPARCPICARPPGNADARRDTCRSSRRALRQKPSAARRG